MNRGSANDGAGNVPTVVSMLAEQYSGATMFAILLDHHSQLSCDGETFPSQVGHSVSCSCGEGDQIDCAYYRRVCSHMLGEDGKSWDLSLFRREPLYSTRRPVHRQVVRFSYHPRVNRLRDLAVRMNPAWGSAEARFMAAHEEYMQKSLECKRASVYVDGTKSFRRAALMAASPRVHLKVLYLVRDGRGFARSYARVRNLPSPGLRAGARLWMNGLLRIDTLLARYPHVPVLWVRYEDICRDFEATFRSIFDFAGVAPEPGLTAHIGRHHVLGNNIRFKFDGTIRESRAWRDELTPSEFEELTELMRPGLERFDYL